MANTSPLESYTNWLINEFCWLPPENVEVAEIRDFVERALAVVERQGTAENAELLEIGRRILRHL